MQKARRSSIQSTKTYKAFQAFQPQDLTQAFQFYKDIPDIPVIHDIPTLQTLLHVPAPVQSSTFQCYPVYTGIPPIPAFLLRYDTIGKIELIPSIVLSSDNTKYKNDIQLFLQLFDELSVYRDYH